MGEYADMAINGETCEWCGVFFEASDNPIEGIPCKCNECKKDDLGKIKFQKIIPEGRREKFLWLTMDELKERYPQHFKKVAIDG